MADEKAQRLSELEIKRNRTMADLDAIRGAARSTRRSMEMHVPKQDALMERYIDELEQNEVPEPRRQELYREWHAALKASFAEHNELVKEWERLQVQEEILVRMVIELERQIEELKREMV